jgi:hypothetical protein
MLIRKIKPCYLSTCRHNSTITSSKIPKRISSRNSFGQSLKKKNLSLCRKQHRDTALTGSESNVCCDAAFAVNARNTTLQLQHYPIPQFSHKTSQSIMLLTYEHYASPCSGYPEQQRSRKSWTKAKTPIHVWENMTAFFMQEGSDRKCWKNYLLHDLQE